MTNIENLISQLTIDEKISLLAGRDLWHTMPVERLGIPSIKVTDGPNGVRGSGRDTGPAAVCLPVGTALGATWNTELVERLGGLLADEVKAKGAHILLAPTVNIHRTPIAGRNFECFSEDPYLSGMIASAYVNGLQNNGIGACIKHFVANDQEYQRTSISAEVQERPLHEIYLEPFRLAQQHAKPWTFMSAYNRVNGTFASENDPILKDVLKDAWGFDGLVMSDWFGTYTSNVPAGHLEIEMPGPARWMSAKHVIAALENGSLIMEALDEKVRRILRTIERVGAFENPELREEIGVDRPEHRALLREAAQESIVLLTNSGVLPIDLSQTKTIAVIGELALRPNIMGGGSSQLKAHPIVSPLDGIRVHAGDRANVEFESGCFIHKTMPVLDVSCLHSAENKPGLDLHLFDNLDFSGDPAYNSVVGQTFMGWFADSVPAVSQERFTARLSGFFTAQVDGDHTFGLSSFGKSRFFVDGAVQIDNWDGGQHHAEKTVTLSMTAGKTVAISIEFLWEGDPRWRSFKLGHLPPHSDTMFEDAVALAERSDVVIVVAGLTHEWEAEGFDRVDMKLPGRQNELITRIAAVNPNTVVVLNAGSALEMPWVDDVAAVVDQWYNGLEVGNALADVLFGAVSPSGKLPTTFPKRLQDNPAYINYPGENGKVYYGEGLFVGYRYYDKKDMAPLFPFGHGLSYTRFSYSNLRVSKESFSAESTLTVSCDITNTGTVAGKEIVQLYVHDHHAAVARPEKELKAFAKVSLAPGATQTVAFELDQQAFWYYDSARGGWATEPGAFDIVIGASSRELHLQTTVLLVVDGTESLHTGMTMRALLAHPRGRVVIERHFGDMLEMIESFGVMDYSPEQLAKMAPDPDMLNAAKLAAINDELAQKDDVPKGFADVFPGAGN